MTVRMSTAGPESGELAERLASYRRIREVLERETLSLATSIDGTTFELQASLYGLDHRRGSYVVLETEAGPRLGQITDLRVVSMDAKDAIDGGAGSVRVRLAQGQGILLDSDGGHFHDARVRPAAPGEVGEWFASVRPQRGGLPLGELLMAPGVPAIANGAGLNRHTFMCGQSGSGKTYSLGVLLERVLAETELRVVILDPNSDYVGLPHVRDGADRQLADRYARVPAAVQVWRNDSSGDHLLRLRFTDLDKATQAALLELDPIRDREEYAALVELLHTQVEGKPLITGADQLLASGVPGARELGLRALNLGVLGWQVWGPEAPSLMDELRAPTARCTVIDLGSLPTVQEQRLVTAAALSALWDSRWSRTPCLLVMDEAHNICPAEPEDLLTGLSTQRSVQIAAEGRKYGLYLLASTQRPHKLHENVVSQCDNLLLMRMNSDADLADLRRLFSFIPQGLMAGATSFRLGQALIAGKILPQAAYVQMGERISQEGGADVPTTWADSR